MDASAPDIRSIPVPEDEIEIAAEAIYEGLNGYPWAKLNPKDNYRHLYRGVGRRVLQKLAAARAS